MEERDFARFEFMMSFGPILYIDTGPCCPCVTCGAQTACFKVFFRLCDCHVRLGTGVPWLDINCVSCFMSFFILHHYILPPVSFSDSAALNKPNIWTFM